MPTLSGLIAAILAALASPATATHHSGLLARTAPAAQVQVLRVHRPDERTRTCSARGQNTKVGRVDRKLDPVACEQPPRSKVILTPSGGLDGLFGR